MEIEKKGQGKMFEIKSLTKNVHVKGGVFSRGRYLLGRTESCDLVVNDDSVSAVHAVIEIFDNKAILYDMNSTNGTFVNGDKIIVKEIQLNQSFSLAEVELSFKTYEVATALPPILETLEPSHGNASVKLPPTPKELPKNAPVASSSVPSIVYPLAADPKAEFSEYIFEDRGNLYPIFNYETQKQAVEVIILFKDKVFSVDYLPEGKATYYITGVWHKKDELELPYLGKMDKFPFVDVHNSGSTVHTLTGFDVFHLSDKKKNTGHVGTTVELTGQDLVRLQKADIQIFVRNVEAPPKVAHAPILKRDPDFRKYLFLFMFLVTLLSVGLNLIELPVDEKKDELAPERLATILYKQPLTISKNKAVEKTEDAPKVIQQSPHKVAVQKDVPKEKQPKVEKSDVVETKDQTKKPDPGKRTAVEKKVVKQGTQPITKKDVMAKPLQTTKPSTSAASAKLQTTKSATALSQFESKSIGHVEVYKSADFKSSISSIVAKGGSLNGVKTNGTSGSAGGEFTGATTGVSTGSGSIKTAGIATNQGSLVGATTGVLGDSKGAEGLSAKKAIYTAGIPGETVVLGSMDPDVIRRILLDHLPQFRYCYQKELERTATEASGVIKLNFTIGASGHVAQAGVDGSSALPGDVKKCVVGVLRGIQFPEPMGGGTVEVKQPMNFYPKRI